MSNPLEAVPRALAVTLVLAAANPGTLAAQSGPGPAAAPAAVEQPPAQPPAQAPAGAPQPGLPATPSAAPAAPAGPAASVPPSMPVQPSQIKIRPVEVTATKSRPVPKRAPAPKPEPVQASAPAPKVAVAPPPPPPPVVLPQAVVPSTPAKGAGAPQTAPTIPAQAIGQTVTTIDRDRVSETKAFSVGDVLQESPGISVKQGNGPRDMGVSIRGSNARNGFAVRNIQVFEDGFPVTQPDGLSRTDLTDPHAYGGVDVWRGPSSALFGNYATGGAINFRTRTGGQINGFETGVDVGSFGYLNSYMALGAKSGPWEYALFASEVKADGHLDWNAFETQTVNFLGSYTTANDKLTVKFIHNHLDTDLSVRLSVNQFFLNPFQRNCETAATAAAGCATVGLLANGYAGARVNNTARQAGFGRDDTRTILGTRWEHRVDADTTFQMQYVLDDRNIHQPTGATSADGDYLSQNVMAHVARNHVLLGMPATHLVGFYFNYLPTDGDTFNMMPGGNARIGKLASNAKGYTGNLGARVREEVRPTEQWTLVSGVSIEKTSLHGLSTSYGYAANGNVSSISTVSADREFTNTAWEAGTAYKLSSAFLVRGRVATGYGTPQFSNLFVTPAGIAGNNTQLDAQSTLGYDIGFDFTPTKAFKLSVTGFYEFFENELVTQSAGAGLQSFSFNAPKSEHRGVETAAQWQFMPGWRFTAVYAFNDQIYTEYNERLSAGSKSVLIDRSGNKIPGVSPNEFLTRLGYDQPSGPLKGLGAYVEYQWKDSFHLDNGNFLTAPGYELVNLNIHYNPDISYGWLKGVSGFFEIRNLLDKTYMASANNISNSLNATTGLENAASVLANSTGSIYAGSPRTFYGGVKIKF